MALFGFGKKKEEKESCCCQNGCEKAVQEHKGESADILVLGSGCAKCNALEANTKAALEKLGRNDAMAHVTDFAEIAAMGVMATPALAIGGRVVVSGRVPNVEELVRILSQT
jgi:small redox-active disulfide protein 2